ERGTASWPSTLNPAGDRLLTGGSGVAPQLWDISSTVANPSFVFRSGPANFAIGFNQRGDRLALGSTDGSVRIHETTNPAQGFALQPKTRAEKRRRLKSSRWRSTRAKTKPTNSFPR